MPKRDIVVVGASAGGISALQKLVASLPRDYPGALFVVLHISPHSTGILPEILSRAGPLPASSAKHGEVISPGRIYVAPPDQHLLIAPSGIIRLGHGPKENRFRPAVDPLFRSAALSFGDRVVGIVLTGGLDDGTAGLCTIKAARGLAIVQDPQEAETPSMPLSALRHVNVDYCLRIREIAELLPKLATEIRETEEALGEALPMADEVRVEVQIAADESSAVSLSRLGEPSLFTCPECHGSLLGVPNAVPMRFRCHTGHAYTAAALEDELRDKVENSTWNAIRALQEHAMLLTEIARQPGIAEQDAAELRRRAEDALSRASLVRKALATAMDAA